MSRDLVGSRLPLAVLESPFQFCVSLLSVVFGVGVFVSVIFTALPTFTKVQAEIPEVLSIAWGAALLLGGGAVAISMLLRSRWPNAIYGEAAALPTLGAGWVVYAVGLGLGIGFAGVVPILVGVLLAAACALRVVAIIVSYRVTRSVTTVREELT